MTWQTWIQIVELPVLFALFVYVKSLNDKTNERLTTLVREIFDAIEVVKTSHHDFRVEVARDYAPNSTIASVEDRLTKHIDVQFAQLKDWIRKDSPHDQRG